MNFTEKEKKAKEYICLALDTDDLDEIEEVCSELSEYVGYIKVHAAFLSHGPKVISIIKKHNCKVFLDLKFHDIPNTVAHYARIATMHGVDMFNLHICGGKEMILAAINSAEEEAERDCSARPKIIGVSVLTSLDNGSMNQVGIPGNVNEQVLRLGKLAAETGVDGIICSAADIKHIKDKLPKNFFYVTPGIRPVGVNAHDQKRVMTPGNAVKSGSSLLVIGRAILGTEDKKKAALEIVKEIASVMD